MNWFRLNKANQAPRSCFRVYVLLTNRTFTINYDPQQHQSDHGDIGSLSEVGCTLASGEPSR